MTPREIIKAEYGNATNIMTPEVLYVGALPGGAYELSSGLGLENEPIYGVSVVYVTPEGTRRGIEESKLFHSLREAGEHVGKLRGGTAVNADDLIRIGTEVIQAMSVTCPVCGEKCPSVQAYLAHMATKHPDVEVAGGRR